MLNEEKTSIRSADRYTAWANAVPARIAQVETDFQFDFSDFIDFSSSYEEEEEEDADEAEAQGEEDEEGDHDVPAAVANALLARWAETLTAANIRAQVGPDAVVDRTIVATSLRVLGKVGNTGGLAFCRRILDSDPSLTPQVSRYFDRMMHEQEHQVDETLDDILNADELYLSPWQALWLMEPLRMSDGLTEEQTAWIARCFKSPVSLLRASAGHLLAVHGQAPVADLLTAFEATAVGARPKLVSALAQATGDLEAQALRAVTDGRPLYRMVAEAVLNGS